MMDFHKTALFTLFVALSTTVRCANTVRQPRGAGDCVETFNADSDSFTSPNYPNDYSDNTDCYYYINVDQSPNKYIMLEFSAFSVDSYYDSVSVYDGDSRNDTEIGPFSGRDLPPRIRSSGRRMLVYFHSNGYTTSDGFMAEYTTTSSDCGGIFTKASGIITSPGYPSRYQGDQDCYYFIIAPEGARLMIQFEHYSFGYDDEISMYSGFNTDRPFASGGYYIDDFLTTESNVMMVHFELDYFSDGIFFLAKYSRDTCSGTYFTDTNEGYIISPLYPSLDGNFFDDCYYIIVVSDGNTIQVEFLDFGLDECCDSLQIYDGDSDRDPLIGRYTGYELPPDIESTGSELYLAFSPYSYSSARGFYLVYHTGTVDAEGPFSVCGNNIAYGINGIITSHATYPSNYPTNQDCNITIVTAGGYNRVALRILKSDLTNTDSPECNTGDAILVYDMYGNIGSVCSSGGYHVFECYGNMTVNFRTFDHAGAHSGFKAYFTLYEEREEYWGDCVDYLDFRCKATSRCLVRRLICNGYDDCGDNSDEVMCPNPGRDNAIMIGCGVVIMVIIIVLIICIMQVYGKQARNSVATRERTSQPPTRQQVYSEIGGPQRNPGNPSAYPT